MCGIVGYIGDKSAVSVLMVGLTKLEYRGYDSAGVAVINGGQVQVRKRVGKLQVLAESLKGEPIDGHIGIGHCLAPGTLIQLADGQVLPIEQIEGNVNVLSLDPTTLKFVLRPATGFRHRAPEMLLEIRTPSTSITCTPEHRMFVIDEETGSLQERQAKDIQAGDILLFAKQIPKPQVTRPLIFTATQPRRYWSLSEGAAQTLRRAVASSGLTHSAVAERAGISLAAMKHLLANDRHARESYLNGLCNALDVLFPVEEAHPVHSHHGNFVRLPATSTPALMQVLGYFWGDGCAHERSIRWKDQQRKVLEHYHELIAALFGLSGRIVPVPDTQAWMLEVNSRDLAEWFRGQLVNRRQEFLRGVGQFSDAELSAFLRGLFDAEGCVASAAGQVSLRMVDVDLVRRVQQWLLRFGIISSFSVLPPNPKRRRIREVGGVYISSAEALQRFAQTIGFSSATKQQELQAVLQSKRVGFTLSAKAIPIRKPVLFRWLLAAGVRPSLLRPFRGKGYLTEPQGRKLIERLKDYPKAEHVRTLLQRYLTGDMVFQEVQSIREVPAPSLYVYDLEVPGTENFIANGLISHNSRWATHGEPSERNAHPHSDCTGRLHVVHNGIIENYRALREELQAAGHRFESETDTESVAHLIEAHYQGSLADAVRCALAKVQGSFALVVLCQDEPDKLVVARRQSPLLLGLGQGENFVASDVPALLRYTRNVIFLDDDEMAVVTRDGVEVTDFEGRVHHKTSVHIDWDAAAAERGGYPHFMLKEIYEQPDVIRRLVSRYTNEDRTQIRLDEMNLSDDELRNVRRICIQACGTSWHAGLIGRLLLERLPRIPVDTDISSEFRYRNAILEPHTLVVGISQSGETADTLAGIREARSRGLKVVSVVNVPGSSVARESDGVIYTHAGPEIGVASTKAYTAQIAALYLFALRLGQLRGEVDAARLQRRLRRLEEVAARMEEVLAQGEHIQTIAEKFYQARDFIFIGRGFGYPSALEGALKLKEISYIHAEGYPAGELKHGPIALIDERMPVVAIATHSEEDLETSKTIYEKILSNIQEVKARKGKVIALAAQGDEVIAQLADHVIYVPKVTYSFTPFVVALPLQLLAYHIAVLRGCDVDQPRNLAKSVTVE